jgi:hypothetical protein
MKALFKFLQDCLKVKEWWKFYGILAFLAFLIYMMFGGVEHAKMLKDYIMEEHVEVQSAVE